jgi:methylmalonyl-CoA mutase C-terminal domain/subunit
VIQLLAEEDAGDVRLLVGGIIPDADVTALEALGVHAVFTPGAGIGGIVETVDRLLAPTGTTATTDTPEPALEQAC